MHQAIIGAQWGDEGKGKVIDFLADKVDVVVRYQGGANAGHTVVVGKERFALHLIPSGILYGDKVCLIGDGVIVHPETLINELVDIKKRVKKTAKLLLSNKVQLVMPWHIIRDGIAGGAIGTTGRGIGPTYMDATGRRGIRVMDWLDKKKFEQRVEEEVIWNQKLIKLMGGKAWLNAEEITADYLQQLKKIKALGVKIVDGSMMLWEADKKGQKILFEGAQATLLDIIHGDYPFVTSSHPTIGGMFIGTGFRPRKLTVTGVVKAYCTRVGNGPFPTELNDKTGEGMRERGHEFGTTTGRPRRCGWLDMEKLKYAVRINGLDQLAVTKLDILTGIKKLKVWVGKYKELPGWSEDITTITQFSNLPINAQKYIRFMEKSSGVSVKFIGVGPEREQIIKL